MKIKVITVVVVLRLNDMVQHNIQYRREKNLCLSFEWTCLLQTKQAMARADLGVGPGDPAPPLVLLNISALHVQYGIQTFAKFKRPECTRLHLREFQSRKVSPRSMRPKLHRKLRRSQS